MSVTNAEANAIALAWKAARAAVEAGMNRQRATLEFMAAYDEAREMARGSSMPPVLKPPNVGDQK